jgi:hypothetical protein
MLVAAARRSGGFRLQCASVIVQRPATRSTRGPISCPPPAVTARHHALAQGPRVEREQTDEARCHCRRRSVIATT